MPVSLKECRPQEDNGRPSPVIIATHEQNPLGDGFLAVFAPVGGVPDFSRHPDDEPEVFATPAEANYAAHKAAVGAMNARMRVESKRIHHTKMSPGDFAVALRDTQMTATEFAHAYGCRQSRVIDWIDGVTDIPFHMHWVLPLMRLPGAMTIVLQETEAHTRTSVEVRDEKRSK